MNDILAKSKPQVTLRQHVEDGLSIWRHLQFCFPAVERCANKKDFWQLLRLSILVHDLGKAHVEFQNLLQGLDNEWYSQRHELFSLPFANQLPLAEKEKQLVMRVVAGHHKSYSSLSKFIQDNYELDSTEFGREFAKVDVKRAIDIVHSFEEKLINSKIIPDAPLKIIADYQREVKQVLMGRQEVISDHFTLLLLTGAFHHCDHMASAFVTKIDGLCDNSFTFLDRMKEDLREKGLDLYYHQRTVSHLIGNVILTAPTGSGKTESAMFWLRNQFKNTGQGRVFYVLPFTASINAMFERLRSTEEGLGEDKVGMLHGKLDAYLYENFFEEAGNLKQVKTQIQELKQIFKNLQIPVKVLTPFQLLKHLFGLKGFEKGIFEWVGGHFIFDEIHAYDPKVTAQIIVLLEYLTNHFRAKIFIMTATMPTFLKVRIGETIGDFYEIRAEPNLYNSLKRHRLMLEDGLLKDNLNLIENDLKVGKSVLVVCNTVDQARIAFKQLSRNSEALLIHGKFTAEDRTNIEKKLHNKPPQLLVGTQAIEVSLNIDYDVIYTELAPLDALIQRFGRVNRKGSKKPCPCIVFKERNEKDKYIYDQAVVERTWKVLEEVEKNNGGVIQEVDLQKYIDQVYPCYNEKSQEKFDKIYNLLTQSVKKIMPFEFSKDREENYYKQFDGIKVLPAYYEKEFKRRLEKFDFIGAEQMKVSIRGNWFARLIDTPDLEYKTHILFPSTKPNVKPIEIQYLKINKRYRPLSGIELDKDEDVKVIVENSENIF